MRSRNVWPLIGLLCLAGCSQKRTVLLVFGTDIKTSGATLFDRVSRELELDYISALTKTDDRYEDTLDYLEKNPTVRHGQEVFSVLEMLGRSEVAVLNYSYQDVLRNAVFSSGGFSYPKERYIADLASYDYHLNLIMSALVDLDDKPRYLALSLFDIYSDGESRRYVDSFNDILKDKCVDYGFVYVDCSDIALEYGSIPERALTMMLERTVRGAVRA